jgi:hypothetical protein
MGRDGGHVAGAVFAGLQVEKVLYRAAQPQPVCRLSQALRRRQLKKVFVWVAPRVVNSKVLTSFPKRTLIGLSTGCGSIIGKL